MNEEFSKSRTIYKVPENVEEAKKCLEMLPSKIFAKLKGKGLTLLESLFEVGDSRLLPTKSLYNSLIAEVSNNLNVQINDCLKVL